MTDEGEGGFRISDGALEKEMEEEEESMAFNSSSTKSSKINKKRRVDDFTNDDDEDDDEQVEEGEQEEEESESEMDSEQEQEEDKMQVSIPQLAPDSLFPMSHQAIKSQSAKRRQMRRAKAARKAVGGNEVRKYGKTAGKVLPPEISSMLGSAHRFFLEAK
jgi:hypothetical protein